MKSPRARLALKNVVISGLKFAVLAGAVTWIIYQSAGDWQSFQDQKKHWGLLAVAFLSVLVAHLVSYWRWRKLVEALGVSMSYFQSMRLGFLGTLFNQVSVGSVGGDLFKAIEATRNAHGKRTEIVGSILVDRAFGLLGLLMVASAGLLSASTLSPRLNAIKWVCLGLSIAGLIGLTVVCMFGRRIPIEWLHRIPKVGETFYRLANVGMVFYHRPYLIGQMLTSSMGVHTFFTLGCAIVSAALFVQRPSLVEHFSTIPPAMAAATLPITPGGVGVQEMAIAALFAELPDVPETYSAVIMATTFRVLLIAVCLIGAVFYFSGLGRRNTAT